MSAEVEGNRAGPSSRIGLRRLLSGVSPRDISRALSRREVSSSPTNSTRLSMFGNGQDTRIHNSTVNATVNYHYTMRSPLDVINADDTQQTSALLGPSPLAATNTNNASAQPSTLENNGTPRDTREVYVDVMITKNRGFPLWIPSPNVSLPLEYRYSGVSIGDVGVITPEGGFDFIFNIFANFRDPINAHSGLSADFSPLSPPLQEFEVLRFKESTSGTLLADDSFTRTDDDSDQYKITLTTEASEAAALIMPSDVYVVKIQNQERLRTYVSTHIVSWYAFVRQTLGRDISNGDLRVVYGYRKSTAFGIAAVSTAKRPAKTHLAFRKNSVWNHESGYKYRWIQQGSADVKTGPEYMESVELMGTSRPLPENQCLFVSTINPKLSAEAWRSIESLPILGINSMQSYIDPSASPLHENRMESNDSDGPRDGQRSGTSFANTYAMQVLLAKSSESIIHPSSILNDVLLELNPEALISIVCDDDWKNSMNCANPFAFVSSILIISGSVMKNNVVFLEQSSVMEERRYMMSQLPTNSLFSTLLTLANESHVPTSKRSTRERRGGNIPGYSVHRSFSRKRDQSETRKMQSTILLLGQSEAGKSTTIKQFQLAQSSGASFTERRNWRGVIYLNLVHSIRRIFDSLAPENDPSYDNYGRDYLTQKKYGTIAVRRDSPPPAMHVEKYLQYREQLRSVASLEQTLRLHLEIPEDEDAEEDEGEEEDNADLLVSPHHPWGHDTGKDIRQLDIWWEDLEDFDPVYTLNPCAPVISQLWRDPQIQTALRAKELRLEETSGFFLDDIDRITAEQYIPTDADILKARLKTSGVIGYNFAMPFDGKRGMELRMYDVGGSRNQRRAWVPYFENADAIIFLAPLSAFDQVLVEDPKVNRMEDSLDLWQNVVSNTLLANAKLILFLNKCDLLKQKLQDGVMLSRFMPKYGARPNDYPSVVHYLQQQFADIHNKHSVNKGRLLHSHVTSVIDTSATAKVISSIRDVITRNILNTTLL